jgi:hypothetical protein
VSHWMAESTDDQLTELDLDVDRDADENGYDPTGGRGVNGNMDGQLAAAKAEDVIKSAV